MNTVAEQLLLLDLQDGGGGAPFADVSLLTSWDGVDGATTATDDSTYGHVPTFEAGAQIDTAQSVFGGASVGRSGIASLVRWPSHASFHIGSDPFCLETFTRFTSLTGANLIIGVWDTIGPGPTDRSWQIEFSSGVFRFQYTLDNITIFEPMTIAPGGGVLVDTWYHVCFERDEADDLRGYIDGIMIQKVTGLNADMFLSNADLFCPGRRSIFLDETRITIGASQYASDSGLTVPASPYPRF